MPESPYQNIVTTPEIQSMLKEITGKDKDWDYQLFKRALIALTASGQYIPAENRPESVDISRLKRGHIDDLKRKSKETKRPFSRIFVVDSEQIQFKSGPLKYGNGPRVDSSIKLEKGREKYQSRVMSIKTYSGDTPNNGPHLQDFKEFLKTKSEIAHIWSHTETNDAYLILKTGATPNNMDPMEIDGSLRKIENDTILSVEQPLDKAAKEFTAQVCLEYGLMLYKADLESDSIAKRVPLNLSTD